MPRIMSHINTSEIEKKIKNETTNSNQFFKTVAYGGPGMVAIIRTKDLKILFVNTQFEHYIGYLNTDLENNDIKFSDLLDNYLCDRFLSQLNLVSENIEASSRFIIYPVKNKKGEALLFYVYASPVNDGDDDKMYIVMHPYLSYWHTPFTSFNTKELFLEHFKSEDFGTFEWIIDVDKVFWSPGLYHIYEVDENRHEINNLFAMAFIHPADKTRVKEATGNAIKNGADLEIEFRIVTAKNNIKIIHCLARTIKKNDGKPIKFVGSIRDVTKQRSIEEDLRNKVEELYHSNKELEEFAYVASHDMQEPLRKITTFSDKLSEKYKDLLSGDGAMYISRIIASAQNMRTLINDLLDFSRISKTQQPFEQVNLNVILRQAKTELELTIEETGTVINSLQLPVIEAIVPQMKQLFINIISNAIKFHKPGIAPVITIDASILADEEKLHNELDKNTTYYKIQVIDNGIGFENEYAARIFQVFQRLHGKAEYPGSGIGLAICKKILEYHQGIIYAENMPGTGARFVFILPQYQPKPFLKTI
jgi:signal transduction histidine kinase